MRVWVVAIRVFGNCPLSEQPRRALAEGMDQEEVAGWLGVSPYVVRAGLRNIVNKVAV
jgi:hypothetical protein